MTLSFWVSLVIALAALGVVLACLAVRRRMHEVEHDVKFWADLHDPPETVKRRPR
jgi:hypothetical protein